MRPSIRLDTLTLTGRSSTYVLLIAWVYANNSSLKWLFESFKQGSSLTLSLISLIVMVLLVRVVRSEHGAVLSATPVLRLYPLLLMLGSTVSAIVIQWFVNIEQLTVLLFLLGTYGLCGLFLTPSFWRQGLPIAYLVACIVPFSSQLSTGFGFPARIITAHAVEQMLSAWHIAAISSEDIIVLENGVAHVDLPCSGLKSLYAGTIFLFAATWLGGRKLGIRWLLVCFFNLFLLLSANTMRVLVLVIVTHILKQPQFAQILHIPLGLIGFGCACALSWMMLQSLSRQEQGYTKTNPDVPPRISIIRDSRHTSSLQAGLLIFVVTLALFSQLIQPQEEQSLSLASLRLPQQMVFERIPLTAAEHSFFDKYPSIVPEKHRFVMGDLSGSILLVANTTWHTYHPPELCLLGSGLQVDRIERKQLTPVVQARWLSLADGKLSATYWFQSPKQTTDDFLSRLWSDVTRHQKNWVLVSVLFDSSLSPESSLIRDFTTAIHDAINLSLKESR
ncbi:MAG: exosortase O [Rhizonema sp. NSF051]|nr:exosortase O [Rhizonema sp. NSF051]